MKAVPDPVQFDYNLFIISFNLFQIRQFVLSEFGGFINPVSLSASKKWPL